MFMHTEIMRNYILATSNLYSGYCNFRASILRKREQSSDILDDESNSDATPQVNDDAPSEWITNYDDGASPSETNDKQKHRRRHSDAVDPALANRFLREQRKRRRVRRHVAIFTIESLMNNLQTRSVCSWKYQINHDITRTPVELPEAVCLNTAVAGSRNRCEQVFYNVPVRNLEISDSGETVWVDKRIPVKVGCTFAIPASVPYTFE